MLAEGQLESIGEGYCARLVIGGPWHVDIEIAVVFAGCEALDKGGPVIVRIVHCRSERLEKHLVQNVANPEDTCSSLLNDSSNADRKYLLGSKRPGFSDCDTK
jgi:hypothetical protein